MIQITSSYQKTDPATARRLALAKVYRLLIRLAEEAERKNHSPENPDIGEEKISEPVSMAED